MRLLLFLLLHAVAICVRAQALVQAEYFWDADPGAGNGTVLSVLDNQFNDVFEQVISHDDAPAQGIHRLGLRVKGLDGVWGPVYRATVDVVAKRVPRLIQAEYFWDTDPGPGNGTLIFAEDNLFTPSFQQVVANATGSGQGLHLLGVRAKGADGTWGTLQRSVVDVVAKRLVQMVQAEYFWDADPGVGNGVPILATDGVMDASFERFIRSASTSALVPGPHLLHARSKGSDGTWGPNLRTVVQIDPPPTLTVSVDLRVALQGCMGTGTLMTNSLRSAGLVPFTEPYTALGYDLGTSAGAVTTAAVMNVTFPPGASVVDWIVVEFIPVNAPWQTALSVPLLLRRGGTVSDVNGQYPFLAQLPAGSYHMIVRHRNHLPVATASPIILDTNGQTVAVDLTASATASYGASSQVLKGALYCMWSGDTNQDQVLKYTGAANDRDVILSSIGGAIPTNTITGYLLEDVNLDGLVKYSGTDNDRDVVLQNIGGIIPTNTRAAQLP